MKFLSCVVHDLRVEVCDGMGLQKVTKKCEHRRRCKVPARPKTFDQDPCPTTSKYLHIVYKCKPSKHLFCPPSLSDDTSITGRHPLIIKFFAQVYPAQRVSLVIFFTLASAFGVFALYT